MAIQNFYPTLEGSGFRSSTSKRLTSNYPIDFSIDFSGLTGKKFNSPLEINLRSRSYGLGTTVTFRLYANGVEVASVAGWSSETTQTFSIPAATANTWIGSTVNFQLTSTSISNMDIYHEDNPDGQRPVASGDVVSSSVSVTATAQIMSATALSKMPQVVAGRAVKHNAGIAEATAAMNDPAVSTVQNHVVNLPILDDATLRSVGSVTDIHREDASIYTAGPTIYDSYLIKVDFSNYSDREFLSAKLRMRVAEPAYLSSDLIITVDGNDWSDAAGDAPNRTLGTNPVSILSVGQEIPAGWVDFNLPIAWIKTLTGVQTLRLEFGQISGTLTTGISVGTLESANPPSIQYVLEPIDAVHVSVDASIANAEASMFDAIGVGGQSAVINAEVAVAGIEPINGVTVSTDRNVYVIADSAIATVSMTDPVVLIINPDVTVSADIADVYADSMMPVVIPGFSHTAQVDEIAGVSLDAFEAEFSSRTPVTIQAGAAQATAKFQKSPRINGIDIAQFDDPFYDWVLANTDSDDYWLRFRETNGQTIVRNSISRGISPYDGKPAYDDLYQVYGNPALNDGPGYHRSIAFDGVDDHLQAYGSHSDNRWSVDREGSLVFHIRTTAQNTYIMGNWSPTFNSFNLFAIVNGRLGYRAGMGIVPASSSINERNFIQTGQTEYSPSMTEASFLMANKHIADGEWHQIALFNVPTATNILRTAVYIDGKLDQVWSDAVHGYAPGRISLPRMIGRSNGGSFFRGELSEIVMWKHFDINKTIVQNAWYNFFDLNPVRPAAMRVNVASGDHVVRGNKRKILGLTWRSKPSMAQNTSVTVPWGLDYEANRANAAWFSGGAYGAYGRMAAWQDFESASQSNIVGADVYWFRVINETWFDPITTMPRLMDLEKDVDIDEYDAIYFGEWPGEQAVINYWLSERGIYGNAGNVDILPDAGHIYQNFLESIKRVVFDRGKELYIASPDMAMELGLIDNYDLHYPNLDRSQRPGTYRMEGGTKEAQRIYAGTGDFHGAYNDPWGTEEARKGIHNEARRQKAIANRWVYAETHWGANHRVRKTLPGFTDLPSWELVEEVWVNNMSEDWRYRAEWSFRYLERPQGLMIGDEFKVNGLASFVDSDSGLISPTAMVSIPPEAVNVGEIIYTEGLYSEDGLDYFVENPRKDYATVIAIEEGSVLNGRTINGRIVIIPNDNASTLFPNTIRYQPIASTADDETAKWQYSTRRFGPITNFFNVGGTQTKWIYDPKSGTAVPSSKNWQGPTIGLPGEMPDEVVFTSPTTAMRAWNWLREKWARELDPPGYKTVHADAMEADFVLNEPNTDARRNVVANATAAGATAQMHRPAEDRGGENVYVATAATMTASMNKAERPYSTDVMRVTMQMNDPVVNKGTIDRRPIVYLTVNRMPQITLVKKGRNK